MVMTRLSLKSLGHLLTLSSGEQLIAVVDNDPIDKVLGKEELRDFMLDKLDFDGDCISTKRSSET